MVRAQPGQGRGFRPGERLEPLDRTHRRAGLLDAGERRAEWFAHHAHEMRGGVQQRLGILDNADMAGPEDQVATALGSPNIVTRDAEGRETWIYDKIATEASYSNSNA